MNRLEKVQHVLDVVIMIHYGLHNGILIVQFKRIIINFISIIGLQIVQCLSYTLFEKVTIRHFIWIRWANAANLKGSLDYLLIPKKIVRSFLYPVDLCWSCTGSLKLVSLFASGKPSTTLATYFTQNLLDTALNGLLRLTSIGWPFEV